MRVMFTAVFGGFMDHQYGLDVKPNCATEAHAGGQHPSMLCAAAASQSYAL